MKIKVFSWGSQSTLEANVNDWIHEQGSMIEIVSTQFSTTAVSSDSDVEYLITEYHAAIWYREL